METTGNARRYLEEDFKEALQQVLDDESEKSSYYILITSGNYGNDVYTKFILLPTSLKKEVLSTYKVLGTMCYAVDNKIGLVERLWCLPFDVPTEGLVETTDEIVPEISQDAFDSKIPVVY